MITALFVHGTGVREQAYQGSFIRVSDALQRIGGVEISQCYWGHLGSTLAAGGASIPNYDTTRAIEADGAPVSDAEYMVALWGLLYDDPLYELRVLALRTGGAERPPGQDAPGDALAARARRFPISPELQALLVKGGLDNVFADARAAVTSSAPFRDALQAAPAALGEDREAIARAFIAESLVRAAAAGIPAPARTDWRLQDEIEAQLVDALGGEERSIGGWVKGHLGGLVGRVGSRYVANRRGAITDGAYPAAGDILLYQSRHQQISGFIRDRILQMPRPRIVIAHSLGGIACVDLLIAEPLEVDLLVTVGSQAPFLYEIGALRSLQHPAPLPEHFPRWLNIYDLRDFLSYVGAGVFPDRVTDVKVDNGQPFPESHSGYWANPKVWAAIKERLP